MIYRIHSRTNQRVKDLIKNKDKFFFLEGEKLVRDILKRGIAITLLIVDEKREEHLVIPGKTSVKEIWYVSPAVLEKVSSLKEKPGFIAVLELEPKAIDFQRAAVVIGLDSIQDPANMGTAFRCAAAFGIDSIALSGTSVNLNNNKFLRAAQHTFFDIHCQRFVDAGALIQRAEAAGFNIYLTSSHEFQNTIAPRQIQQPCLILFGNEGQGLDKTLFTRYPSIKIPQAGKVESLNVGISACIIMYEIGKLLGK